MGCVISTVKCEFLAVSKFMRILSDDLLLFHFQMDQLINSVFIPTVSHSKYYQVTCEFFIFNNLLQRFTQNTIDTSLHLFV